MVPSIVCSVIHGVLLACYFLFVKEMVETVMKIGRMHLFHICKRLRMCNNLTSDLKERIFIFGILIYF